jgi:hypothetical protein
MSVRGVESVMIVPAATDGDIFRAYVEQLLCARLQRGDEWSWITYPRTSSHGYGN